MPIDNINLLNLPVSKMFTISGGISLVGNSKDLALENTVAAK
ncbi:hypothetical protein [Rickettsiales endosymbiont of Peranema trichophorum]|nr:hypothetical protein [Rickettsiales endosymbiont of Peranema trichophorum]